MLDVATLTSVLQTPSIQNMLSIPGTARNGALLSEPCKDSWQGALVEVGWEKAGRDLKASPGQEYQEIGNKTSKECT